MSEQKFYKRELSGSTRYIQVLHEVDEAATEVLMVDLARTEYLSDYKLSWVSPKWINWTAISKQDFFAAVAKYAAIDAELGS